MPGTILDVLPRPTRLTLAGRPYLVGPLRLADVATLQGWIAGVAGDPLDAIPPFDPTGDPEARRNALARAWRAAKTWPPAYGSPAAQAYMETSAGRAVFVLVAARLDDPDEAAEVAGAMTPAEWAALRDVAYAVPPWKAIAAELDPFSMAGGGPGKAPNWGEEFEALSAERGWTYEQIGALTIPEWRNIQRGGRAEGFRAIPMPGEGPEDTMRRTRAAFRVVE